MVPPPLHTASVPHSPLGPCRGLPILAGHTYLDRMLKPFEFCFPTQTATVPSGPDWLHELKYDGYWLRLERDGDRVRLTTRGGYNWTDCYPWIVETARNVRRKRFVLDGEAVVLGVDGVSDFNALHSRKHDHKVQFCAFDILVDGDIPHLAITAPDRGAGCGSRTSTA